MKEIILYFGISLVLAHFLLYAVYLFHANILPGYYLLYLCILGILSLNLFLGNMVNSRRYPLFTECDE